MVEIAAIGELSIDSLTSIGSGFKVPSISSAMRDALSIFDRVVSFSGKNLTRKAVTENLNVLDYDTYFK